MPKEFVKSFPPLRPNSKLLVLGAGFSGRRVANVVKAQGRTVICSRRNINSSGADIEFDSNSKDLPPIDDLKTITHVLSCIPPLATGEDPVLTKFLNHLKEMPLQWIGYLSTTGVYGDSKGEWVTENDIPKPQQPRSIRRLACEEAWKHSGLPIQILRLPGIYGPNRSALENFKNEKCKIIEKPGQVFSRIHVDDIAGAVLHLIHKASQGEWPLVVNIADDLPTSNKDVLNFAAKLLEKPLPMVEPFERAIEEMSAMAISFWQENRRVSNHLLCKELGYSLLHPDYQSGLKDCLKHFKYQKNTNPNYS